MAIKKNNMSKEELLGALSETAARQAGRTELPKRADYDASKNSLYDIRHYTVADYKEAVAYFEDISPANPDMNEIAVFALQACISNGWT